MKFILPFVAIIFLSGCNRDAPHESGTKPRDSIVAMDAYNLRVAVPAPAERIVSLAPNLTELVFALGAGDRLVGDTRWCTYPAAAQSITKVGDLQTPNYELIAALKPDVTLMSFSGNMPLAYEKLRALGMRPFLTSSKSIEDVEMTIRTIAHLINRDSIGAALADVMCAAIDSQRARAAQHAAVDAIIMLSVDPPVCVGNGFLDEALAVAGGNNVAHNEIVAYPQINREMVLAWKPRVIFIPTDVVETTDEIWHMFPEWKTLRRAGTQIIRIDADPLLRPGPRIVQGIAAMANVMQKP